MTSIIRNHDLAAAGQKKIAWVEHYMPTLNNIGERLKKEQTFQNKTVVVSVHLEAKTAYLALVLHRAGAKVVVTGSNPLSTQDDVAAALVAEGLTVYATYNCTEEEYFAYLNVLLIINRISSLMTAATWFTSYIQRVRMPRSDS